VRSRPIQTSAPRLVCLLVTGLLLSATRGQAQATSQLVRVMGEDPRGLADALTADGYDVLPHTAEDADSVRAIVQPAELDALDALGLDLTVLARGRPYAEIAAQATASDGSPPAGYPDLASIEAQMAALAAAHPSRCAFVDLTNATGSPPTAEGRHLYGLRISDDAATEQDEPQALIVAAHHCRELVTPLIALGIAERLLEGYGVDTDVTAAVDAQTIWIVPVCNPDGYAYVFSTDNFWRKNRRVLTTDVGVDLNRNYPLGWDSACSGSTDESSATYKGATAASEAEVMAVMTLAAERNVAKVIDYHSSGQEVLWGYDCLAHPLSAWLQSEAIALSVASGYAGAERPPSADGEHFQWELGALGAHSFLVETALEFQPTIEEALAEVELVWPGALSMLLQPVPVSGHVRDACTNLPIEATVSVPSLVYENGEAHVTGGPFGRYHVFLPPGAWSLRYSAPGYATLDLPVTVVDGVALEQDVALTPLVPAGCWSVHGAGTAGLQGTPALSGTGTLAALEPGSIDLVDARPNAPVHLIVGFSVLDLPFKGGVMVPQPDLILDLVALGDGSLQLQFALPSGLPAASFFVLQCWINDDAGPAGFSSSNGLEAVTP
jgi:hypothetical protein